MGPVEAVSDSFDPVPQKGVLPMKDLAAIPTTAHTALRDRYPD